MGICPFYFLIAIFEDGSYWQVHRFQRTQQPDSEGTKLACMMEALVETGFCSC